MTDTSVRVLFLGDSAGAKKASAETDAAMQGVSKSAKKASAESSTAFSGSMKSVSKSAEGASSAIVSSFAAAGKAVAVTGAVIAATIGATIAGGLIGATVEAVKFDAAMRNVNSIAGLSEDSFQKLSKQVLSLSKSTGQGPTVLAKGLYDIVSSGFKANAAIVILKQSAIAATAGLTDTATASNAIVGALNAFHLPAVAAKNVASDLFETVNKGVVSFPELAGQMGTITSGAQVLGVSLQETTAAFARLTLEGGRADDRATQVHRVLTSLIAPSKEMTAALHSLGYENANVALKTDTLQTLLQKLWMATGQNATALHKLFPDQRAFAGALGLTGENAKQAQTFLTANNKAYKDGTAQTKAFLEQQKSIAVQWQLTKAGIEAAAVPLGAVFFPALRSVLGEAGKFADFLSTLDKKRTITAKLDFAWKSAEGIGKHLWTQLSSAITGNSIKTQIVVPGTAVTFAEHDQGLASKFWDWFGKQIGTDQHGIQIGPQLLMVNHNDPTLRDQITKMVQGINWAPIGAAISVGISSSIVITTKAFDSFGQAATAWANTHSGQIANVGALIGLKIVATLLDPGFWIAHWQLIGGLALTALPAGKFAEIGGKAAALIFGKFGDAILPLFRDAMLTLPPAIGALGARFGSAIGDLIGKMGPIAIKATLDLVDTIIRGFSKGFGKLGLIVRLLLNTGLVAAIGGLIGAAVSEAAKLASAIVGGIAKLPDLAGKLGAAIEAGVKSIPGLGADALGKLKDVGASVVSTIVGGLSGLGASMLSAIESEISGIHIPTPHVHLGHVGAGPIQIPYPTSITFAKGGEISQPMLATVGEDAPRYPEYIIPTNPKYAGRAAGLLGQAAGALGIKGYAKGGVTGKNAPLFNHEGPDEYGAAYQHNRAFAKPGPYQTKLSGSEEKAFRAWLKKYKIPFDPDASTVDYDMRGYWKSNHNATHSSGQHFPDTWKTPYDTTFSDESRYATKNNPFEWVGNNLVDKRSNQLVFGHRANGGLVNAPMIMVGEEAPQHPEFIIPTNPSYRDRAVGLLSQAASALGVRGYAKGGVVRGGEATLLPKTKHPARAPNRKPGPIKGGGSINGPIGAPELGDIVSAANRALKSVTDAGQAVDDAGTHYDLAARIADQSQETFLLDVPDDPTDPASATHQVRNEADITKRLGELSYLQDLKQGMTALMIDQKAKITAAIAALQALIKRLLDDIKKLKDQVAEQLSTAKKERTAQGAETRSANADRKSIATEEAKKKPNQGKIKGWRADATTHEAAAKQHGKNAEAADKQRERLNTEIGNRVSAIKDYTGDIATQRQSLLPQGIPYNIATAGLDLSDLQTEAASVSGTKGTLAAAIIPGGATTTDTGSIDGTTTDDSAQLAALQAQLAQYRLALGIQTTQLSVIGGAAGFAKGSLYVPDTGYALLHRGESINTAAQNAGRDPGGNAGPVQVTVNLMGELGMLKDMITATVDSSTDRIALNIGTSSDVRLRSNAH